MSTEVATTVDPQTALAAYLAGDSDPFSQYAKDNDVTDANGFLRFSGNTGKWTVGDDDLGDEILFAFNVLEAKHGWYGWQNSKPVYKELTSIIGGQRVSMEADLPPLQQIKESDGYTRVVEVLVRDMDFEFPQMSLTLPAGEGYRPINRLVKKFGEEVKSNIDDQGTPMVPIVELSSESFDSKGGKKYAPILKIVDWIAVPELDEMAASAEPESDGDEAPDTPAEVEDKAPAEAETKTSGKRGSFRDQRRGAKK